MATLILQHRLEGQLADATSVLQRSEDGTYGIRNDASGAIEVAPSATPMTPTSLGVYEVNVDTLLAGRYTAAFEVTDSPEPPRWEYIPFTVDEVATGVIGTRLMDIESALARRLGPYFRRTVTTGSQNLVTINGVKSTIDAGEFEDLYLLRRGFLANGQRIVGFDDDDRIRTIATYDHTNGTFAPDRTWAIAPVANEIVELMALHPEDELRYVVIEGLRRCFFLDAVTVAFVTADVEQNVSSFLPWLTEPDLIKDVQYTYNASLYGPTGVGWFKPFRTGQDIYLRMGANPYPNSTRLTILRPAHTYVNGATSLVGPDDDEDIVAVDRNYATLAAHVEAWRNFPAKLMPIAQNGMAPSLKQVSNEFTLESFKHRYKRDILPQYSVPYSPNVPVLNL